MNAPSRRRGPYRLTVADSRPVTPSMRRISLTGEALADFPADRPGAHLKLFLPRPGQSEPVLPQLRENGPVWPPAHERPITRTYSVRRFDARRRRLDIDFVLHGDAGPASAWARRAAVGDVVGIAGPGGPHPMLAPADWMLLAGDITALPAIAALLESLPATVRGHAFVQLPARADIPWLDYAADIDIDWLIAPHAATADTPLVAAVRGYTPPAGTGSAWVAAENASVLALRAHLRRDLGIDKRRLYAVPYWKATLAEEAYHAERHRVMDAFVDDA